MDIRLWVRPDLGRTRSTLQKLTLAKDYRLDREARLETEISEISDLIHLTSLLSLAIVGSGRLPCARWGAGHGA
ncbi:uncharacterized protein BDV17DRAFT_254365 [Aspergillus undulatus]|uniref:uncharacterized protein n=1 Tax=Aspergillus undulatus TaxID=1810928 RepID=UPI003CCCE13F